MATLEIDRVKKSYGHMDVLKEVSISVGMVIFWCCWGRQVAENRRS